MIRGKHLFQTLPHRLAIETKKKQDKRIGSDACVSRCTLYGRTCRVVIRVCATRTSCVKMWNKNLF